VGIIDGWFDWIYNGMWIKSYRRKYKMSKLTEKFSLKNKIIVGIVVAALLVGAIFFATNAVGYAPQTFPVKNIFVDVNGDGMVDLLVSGEVILNAGVAPQANFQ
jgi:hypothetical protein